MKLEELYYAGSHGMDIRGPTAAASEYNHNMKAKQVSNYVTLSL